MAKKLRGEEVRAAQGQAAAAALNAEAAARRKAEEDAKRQARVNREIAADLLATPTHVTGPIAPDAAIFAYGDSEDDEEPEVDLIEAGRWRRGPNGNLELIPGDMSPEAIANRAVGIPEGAIDRPAGIPAGLTTRIATFILTEYGA